jgi:serine/threonine protein phosphatase 1
MSLIYAISDIHGYLQPLEEALSLVDLESDIENKLIVCGDYIDYGWFLSQLL